MPHILITRSFITAMNDFCSFDVKLAIIFITKPSWRGQRAHNNVSNLMRGSPFFPLKQRV